jgi:iron complex transport system ATP-binding protein
MKIKVHGAGFNYKGTENCGFKNINFSLETGEFMCILGPNGCGKTTLLKSLNRLYKLDNGSIEINDRNIETLSRSEIARAVGYVPQLHQPAFSFSVLEVVLMGRAPHLGPLSSPKEKDVRIAENAIASLGISHLKDKPYTQISGGERQMVVFARVLAQKPSLILLDEPTSHLDFGNQIRLLKIVEKLSQTGIPIIMTSHFPDHAFMVSSKVALMKNGELIDLGTPENVITEKNLKIVYNMRVKVMSVDNGVKRNICVPIGDNNLSDIQLDFQSK